MAKAEMEKEKLENAEKLAELEKAKSAVETPEIPDENPEILETPIEKIAYQRMKVHETLGKLAINLSLALTNGNPLADSNIKVAEFFSGKYADDGYQKWAEKMENRNIIITGISCNEKQFGKKYCDLEIADALFTVKFFAIAYDFHVLKLKIAGKELETETGFLATENSVDDLISESLPISA